MTTQMTTHVYKCTDSFFFPLDISYYWIDHSFLECRVTFYQYYGSHESVSNTHYWIHISFPSHSKHIIVFIEHS